MTDDEKRLTYLPLQAQWMRQIYLQGNQAGIKPQSTQYEVLKQQAKDILPKEHYNYVEGGASTQATERGNRAIFEQWQISAWRGRGWETPKETEATVNGAP